MSQYISHIANAIPGREKMSYLELGIWHKVNFNNIFYGRKIGVDIRPYCEADYVGSTDAFFSENTERFDVVFIDASHLVENVLKDYNNAIKICDKVLLMHDMIPEHKGKACEDGNLCGTGFRVLAKMWEMGMEPWVLNSDAGLTMFLPPFVPIEDFDKTLTYESFMESVKTKKLFSVKEVLEKIRDTSFGQ